MPTASLLIIQATNPDAPKVTVTVTGPQNTDRARVLKVLAHLLGSGQEWDGEMPNVELIATGEVVG